MTQNGRGVEKATPASEWRKAREEGVLFHFPSGMTAKVRPVNVDTFIKLGEVPDMLTTLVSKLTDTSAATGLSKITADDYMKTLGVYNAFCITCFIEPKCVATNPKDNEISVDDISDTDKQTLFQFLGAPASALARFPGVQEDSVDSVVSEQGNPAST